MSSVLCPLSSVLWSGGLAATYSSAAVAAVPLALRGLTAEFGMGSGVWALAVATRPLRFPDGRRLRAGVGDEGGRELRGSCVLSSGLTRGEGMGKAVSSD